MRGSGKVFRVMCWTDITALFAFPFIGGAGLWLYPDVGYTPETAELLWGQWGGLLGLWATTMC